VVVHAQQLALAQAERTHDFATGHQAVFGPPQAVLAEPEKHRGELLKRFSDHALELSRAAPGHGNASLVGACSIPGPVVQRPVSDEEVALSLDVTCGR
jgi:hypothetical protein